MLLTESSLTLATPRLSLRPLRDGDERLMWPHVSDPEVSRYMAWAPHADLGQTRDFVHVDDVAAANVVAAQADRGGFFAANVCSGQPISILEVATQLCQARDSVVSPLVTGQYRSGDVRHIVADPARAAEVLGFRAVVKPREGLRDFAFAPLRG